MTLVAIVMFREINLVRGYSSPFIHQFHYHHKTKTSKMVIMKNKSHASGIALITVFLFSGVVQLMS